MPVISSALWVSLILVKFLMSENNIHNSVFCDVALPLEMIRSLISPSTYWPKRVLIRSFNLRISILPTPRDKAKKAPPIIM